MGCAGASGVPSALRARPVGELVTRELETRPGRFMEDAKFVPVVDGWMLPDEPGTLFARGELHDVPLLVGANADEGNLFVALQPEAFDGLGADECRRRLDDYFGERTGEVLKLFPPEGQGGVKAALSAIFTAFDFSAAARFAAACVARKGQKAYLYKFSRVPPRDPLGACHGLEVPFMFGSLIEGVTSLAEKRAWPAPLLKSLEKGLLEALAFTFDHADLTLSGKMMDAWVRFAATGDPGPGGGEAWPPFDARTGAGIEFAKNVSVFSGLDEQACDLADAFYGYAQGAA